MPDMPAPTTAVAEKGPMQISRAVLIVTGVVSLIAGLLVIFYPGPSLVFVAIVTGINLLVIGVLGLVDLVIVRDEAEESRLLSAIVYTLALLAGIVVLRHPADSVLAVVVVLGVWFVAVGVLGLVGAIFRGGHRARRAVGALAEVVVGVLVLSLPDVSVKTIAVLAGIAFTIRGVVLIVEGARYAHDPVAG